MLEKGTSYKGEANSEFKNMIIHVTAYFISYSSSKNKDK